MKKVLYLLFFITLGFISIKDVYAEPNNLMQCEYLFRVLNNESAFYLKYRITYRDDGTTYQEMAQNGNTEYSGGTWQGSHLNFNATMLTESGAVKIDRNGNSNNLNNLDAADFTDEVMKVYYDSKTCPYVAYFMEGNYISPQNDRNLHQYGGQYIWVSPDRGTMTLFNEQGQGEVVDDPEITTSCAIHTNDDALPEVPGFTMEFQMDENGQKYFKVYFNGEEKDAQIIKVNDGEGVSANLSTNRLHDFAIVLPAEEIPNIYKQNFQQINHNQFSCPSEGSIYFIEESYSEGAYRLSTDADKAAEYDDHATPTNPGIGGETNINNNLEWDVDECETLLGLATDPNAPAYWLNMAFQIIKYVAIVLLFVLTIVEFAKAIPSGKDDAIKKAAQNTIKRLIIAVLIFFLPELINFILELLGIVSDPSTCGIS